MATVPYKEEIEYNGLTLPFSMVIKDGITEPVEIEEHWHDWYQMIYMMSGQAEIIVNSTEKIIKKDDMVILKGGDVHAFSVYDPQARYTILMFHPDIIENIGGSIFESKYITAFLMGLKSDTYYIAPSNENFGKIHMVMSGLLEEYRDQAVGYEIYIKGYIYQLIAILKRYNIFEIQPFKTKEMLKLDQLFNYIESNYDQTIDLKQAADYLNLSYSYFSKYFKEVTGKTFKSYLDYVRVSEAEKLILLKGYNITEAAYAVGFSDVSSFNRVFKRIKNYTPKELKSIKTVKK